MFGISFPELMIIAALVLVVAGPEKLPEFARWAGKGMRELRKASNTLRDALMIDDLDLDKPAKRITTSAPQASAAPPAAGAAQAVSAETSADAAPTTRVSTASAPRERYPSAEPSGLDQLDERDFDRLLEQQYLLHHNQLKAVALTPALASTETHAVSLSAASAEAEPDQATRHAVALVASQAPEPMR
ncbi:twin-arginine translocase TatA/TatE family subunit [Lujinxingia vulgaris]|uniref:Twin-arginine translocase TatA/TatE family subunit n=1 Tax=Lujinxingia vulgaris TaxID=2600176 RepID=A0A5C6X8R6_9DELT|nr:twin-arginine translocase TatA/TatE family subunit [Lujinxingia vulgaris]TXD35551.1 twin-arginine translocase TatA/TatE family subunit [Lujinxingia vulgaris]